MPGLNFIAVNISGRSPLCRLCGESKIEWSTTRHESVWLCFGCDIGAD